MQLQTVVFARMLIRPHQIANKFRSREKLFPTERNRILSRRQSEQAVPEFTFQPGPLEVITRRLSGWHLSVLLSNHHLLFAWWLAALTGLTRALTGGSLDSDFLRVLNTFLINQLFLCWFEKFHSSAPFSGSWRGWRLIWDRFEIGDRMARGFSQSTSIFDHLNHNLKHSYQFKTTF